MAKEERNYGIELLKMVTMISTMTLHVLGKGGVIAKLSPLSPMYEVAWAIEILCYYAGPAYALISGYVGYKGRYRVTNIIYLWLQVFFYTGGYTALYFIFVPETRNFTNLINAFFPALTGAYWYFSAYFGVFFLIPAIMFVVEKLEEMYLKVILFFVIVFLSILPPFFGADVFSLKGGTSFTWMMACFFIGAYLKKTAILDKLKTRWYVAGFFVCAFLTWLSKLAIELYYGIEVWNRDRGNLFLSYNSPTIVMCAICLIPVFSRFKIGPKSAKVIKVVAPLSFGVYLANCQPLAWEYIMTDRFSHIADLPLWKMVICTLLSGFMVFLIGVVIDGIRFILFELIGLRKRLNVLDDCIKQRLAVREK